MRQHMIAAIDGPAGSGKSSVARLSASLLGYTHLNSGALYRCVALLALRRRAALNDEAGLSALAEDADMRFGHGGAVLLNGEDVSVELYTSAVTEAAAKAAVHPSVREAMTAQQRKIAAEGDVVVEGRDVTTVVFPYAQAKFYLDASIEERARRRHKELAEAGETVSLEAIEREIRKRDMQDQTRKHSPLRIAQDALVIDTTPLTIEQAAEAVVARVKELTACE